MITCDLNLKYNSRSRVSRRVDFFPTAATKWEGIKQGPLEMLWGSGYPSDSLASCRTSLTYAQTDVVIKACTTTTVLPHSTFGVRWPFDTPWYPIGHFLLVVLGTASLCPAVCALSVLASRVWPFGGHVTLSITWQFDTPYAISYWWSFGTKPVSLTVSEIFNVECNAMLTWPWYDL